MGNAYRGRTEHSAEYFGDCRDYWWNEDYLGFLAAQHWQLGSAGSALDVGAGIGHWSRLLARLSPELSFVGIDREPEWVERANALAHEAELGARLRYQLGRGEALPFDADTFDLVTCQTVLIHVPAPERVLSEMVRVLRPGGLVIVAEPTNVAGSLTDSIALGDSAEDAAALLGFVLSCHRGRALLGEGDLLIGESLGHLLSRAGLERVEVRLNDRPLAVAPPYASPFEQLFIEDLEDSVARGLAVWDETTTRRYFLATGQSEAAFDTGWHLALAQKTRVLSAMKAGTFHCSGGSLFYVAWGRKPS